MSSEIIAALIGVLLGGAWQAAVAHWDRKREAEAVLTAIAAEVDAICRLVRHRRYLPSVRELLKAMQSGGQPVYLSIDIKENYFSVFDALAPKLGTLSPKNAARIVNFYAYCKSVIDSTRSDGNLSAGADHGQLELNLVELERILTAALMLGDQIVQLPKLSLATDL